MLGDQDISYSLIRAVCEGRLERVRQLISYYGLPYSQAWSEGYDLLCVAVENENTEVAKLLLTNGSKVNSQNKLPLDTPLHFAVRNGDMEIVKMLLDRGANIDAINLSDVTPLHIAVESKKVEVVELLLNHGACVNVRNCNSSTPLLLAAKEGSEEIVKLLLKHGADVNSAYTKTALEGYTPLCLAVKGGHEKVVQLLLECGTNVNAQGKDGKTALHFAVEKGQENDQLLLEFGANVDAEDKDGESLLHSAVEKGDSLIIEHVLKHCPDVNNKSNRSAINVAVHGCRVGYGKIIENLLHYGFTVNPEDVNDCKLLHAAVEKGYFKIVEGLLQYGIDVNMLYSSTSREGYMPLHIATKKKQEEIAKLLISYGADVNAQDETGKTPIFYATENRDLKITRLLLTNKANVKDNPELLNIAVSKEYREIVEVLLEHGADVNISNKYGRTALHFTVLGEDGRFCGYSPGKDRNVNVMGEISNLLLSWGADANAEIENGITTLHVASRHGYVKVVEDLLEHNADVNCTVKKNAIPHHNAAYEGHLDVEALLKFGAGMDSKMNAGKTALHFAAEEGHLGVVKVLLKFGASIDSKDEDGRTALHFAAEQGHLGVVKILLKFGASIDSKDEDGRTALHFAAEQGHLGVVKILLKFGAGIDSRNKYGSTPLHFAAQSGHLGVVKVLLKFGAGINSKDGDGNIPLHFAAEGHLDIVEVLLKFGASIDSKDENGITPLHIACDDGHEQTVIALLEHGSDVNIVTKNNKTALDIAMAHFSSIADILKCHIVRMKTANLFVSEKNLLSISTNEEISDFQNGCEEEIASMKSEKVGNANVSFYDIMTKGISQLAMYAGNESIVQILRSDDYKVKFPIYASMIYSNYRKGERRKQLLEQGHEIFHSFCNNLPVLPRDCTAKIFSYLSDKDLRILIDVCKPVSVSSPNN